VLLAEDEQFQRDAFEALFAAANRRLGGKLLFSVKLVSCADEVMAAIQETTDWQLVLLDINMPGTSGSPGPGGSEIISDVRMTLGDKVPVLMVSAAAQMGAVHTCLQRGADLFMAKPLHVNVLENLWQHVLKKDPQWFERQTHVNWHAVVRGEGESEMPMGSPMEGEDPGACKQQ